MYQHPKDKDLPGFTRDSEGRPKPGYHNPTPPGDGGAYGVDTDSDSDTWMRTGSPGGIADAFGAAMYGQRGWEERRKRAERQRRTKSVLTWATTAGCGILFVLILVAAVLGMIVLISWLVSLL